jgi:hypothetical protein
MVYTSAKGVIKSKKVDVIAMDEHEGNFTKGFAWAMLLSLPLWAGVIGIIRFISK